MQIHRFKIMDYKKFVYEQKKRDKILESKIYTSNC
jgi:translation initiation factor IF-3